MNTTPSAGRIELNKYATHLPLLLKCLAVTTGPVLELGMGESSTPVLHEICRAMNRNLVSYDTDPKFVDTYQRRYGPDNFQHAIRHCGREDWAKAAIDRPRSVPWSVVLIDHRPARQRRYEALRLRKFAEYIVCHDTEPEIDRFYRYSGIWPHFSFVLHSNEIPRTTVLSNLRSEL